MTNEQAIRALRQFQLDPRVAWMPEPIGIEDRWLTTASAKSQSPKRWMDAYLSAFARLAAHVSSHSTTVFSRLYHSLSC